MCIRDREYSWEIVEGGGDPKETHLETAHRELMEEAGLKAKKWTVLGSEVHLTNSHSDEKAWLYLAEELSSCEPEPDPTEVIEIKKVPFSAFLQSVSEGKIKDSISIIAAYRLEQLLSQRK